mmetsp:Transcript_81146/g.160862  ORF Transcript_81146/g.160862 Transcript_81146/m.160862 type:complete len:641 (+) Transcript_81146:48-1970(+)
MMPTVGTQLASLPLTARLHPDVTQRCHRRCNAGAFLGVLNGSSQVKFGAIAAASFAVTGKRLRRRRAKAVAAASAAVSAAAPSAAAIPDQGARQQQLVKTTPARSSFGTSWLSLLRDAWKPEALRGNWSPVHEECTDLHASVVAGAIPMDFPCGHFVQNGPNPRWVRPNAGYHPFEGDGMLHSVEFVREASSSDHAGGGGGGAGASASAGACGRTGIGVSGRSHDKCSVRYSNRWVRTAKWLAEDLVQQPLASGFFDGNVVRLGANALMNTSALLGGLPRLLSGAGSVAGGGSGTANTSVVQHAGKVLALQEGSKPIVVTLPHMDTEGPLQQSQSFTAHPKVCPVTKELMWFSYGNPAGLIYGVWDSDGHPVHQTVIPLPHSVMVHDIAVTRHHTVILDCPLELAPDLAKGEGPVHLNKDVPMRFGIMPRYGNGSDVRWYEVPGPGQMCFHVMNAYECSSGEIVVIGCAQPDVSIGDMNVQHSHMERLTEWRIDPRMDRVTERIVSNVPCDFPRVNEQLVGLPFRFGYAAAFDPNNQGTNVPKFIGITKHDVDSAVTQLWTPGEAIYVGEPVYVPRVGANPANEDDGYVLVHAHDERRKMSEIIILDAHNFGAGRLPVCRIELPRRVPYGFHVNWISTEA